MLYGVAEPSPSTGLEKDRDEIERALIGGLFLNFDFYPRHAEQIKTWLFQEPVHQRVIEILAQDLAADRLSDPVHVDERMKPSDRYEKLGGLKYLADLVDQAPEDDAGLEGMLWMLQRLARQEYSASIKRGAKLDIRAQPETAGRKAAQRRALP